MRTFRKEPRKGERAVLYREDAGGREEIPGVVRKEYAFGVDFFPDAGGEWFVQREALGADPFKPAANQSFPFALVRVRPVRQKRGRKCFGSREVMDDSYRDWQNRGDDLRRVCPSCGRLLKCRVEVRSLSRSQGISDDWLVMPTHYAK